MTAPEQDQTEKLTNDLITADSIEEATKAIRQLRKNKIASFPTAQGKVEVESIAKQLASAEVKNAIRTAEDRVTLYDTLNKLEQQGKLIGITRTIAIKEWEKKHKK